MTTVKRQVKRETSEKIRQNQKLHKNKEKKSKKKERKKEKRKRQYDAVDPTNPFLSEYCPDTTLIVSSTIVYIWRRIDTAMAHHRERVYGLNHRLYRAVLWIPRLGSVSAPR